MCVEDEEGGVTIGVLFLFLGLLLAATVALDLTRWNQQRSHVQAQADFAALEAVRTTGSDADRTFAMAERSVRANDEFEALPLLQDQVVRGHFDGNRFVPTDGQGRRPNAVAVQVGSDAELALSLALPNRVPTIRRDAIAAIDERLSFSLANCLLSLDLFKGALQPVLGAQAHVLCSDGLAALQVDSFLVQLGTRTGIGGTYENMLQTRVDLGDVLSVATEHEVAPQGVTVILGSFLKLGADLRGLPLGAALHGAEVSVADVVFGAVESAGTHGLRIEAMVDLGPLARVPVTVTIGEPRKVVIGVRPDDPQAEARTAQLRLVVDRLDLLGLAELSLRLELAHADARVSAASPMCGAHAEGPAVILDPVQAGLARLDVELRAGILQGADSIDLLQSGRQALWFTASDIAQHRSQIVAPRLRGTVEDLLMELHDLLNAGGQDGLAQAVSIGYGLSPSVSPVEILLDSVMHDVIGLALAPATLTVFDTECTLHLVR